MLREALCSPITSSWAWLVGLFFYNNLQYKNCRGELWLIQNSEIMSTTGPRTWCLFLNATNPCSCRSLANPTETKFSQEEAGEDCPSVSPSTHASIHGSSLVLESWLNGETQYVSCDHSSTTNLVCPRERTSLLWAFVFYPIKWK